LAGLAIEEPEFENIGFARFRDAGDRFKIAVEEVALEVALDKSDAPRKLI
jgi:hypothetical protein